ncbi:F-box and wd40 domain protein [Reticulomyxa filosa]|uniref:F-box and wd40 domain protein n=1 Tax=Reticulomyxa filosa TaxID=46433 RepID=X6PD38_RETFI|nr:F-box and wd40 domain protein [Reticulomyxa filosa]|eukprot:ETO36023.1 F-box and wd40 domain protein [Reticulomyxa filosa]
MEKINYHHKILFYAFSFLCNILYLYLSYVVIFKIEITKIKDNEINNEHKEPQSESINKDNDSLSKTSYFNFSFDLFCSSRKLLKNYIGHSSTLYNIDYSTFNNDQYLYSGSDDNAVRLCDVETAKQLRRIDGHSIAVFCVKFSSYYFHSHNKLIICSSSNDPTIHFWNFETAKEIQFFKRMQVFIVLDFLHLHLVGICVLDHMTKQFIYLMLKYLSHCICTMYMQLVFEIFTITNYYSRLQKKLP